MVKLFLPCSCYIRVITIDLVSSGCLSGIIFRNIFSAIRITFLIRDLCWRHRLIVHDDERETGPGQTLMGSKHLRRKMEILRMDDRLPHLHQIRIGAASCQKLMRTIQVIGNIRHVVLYEISFFYFSRFDARWSVRKFLALSITISNTFLCCT